VEFVKLLDTAPMGSLHLSVSLGEWGSRIKSLIPRWEQATSNSAMNSGPPSNLYSLYRERHATHYLIQEISGGRSGSSAAGSYHIPIANSVLGDEVFQEYTGQRTDIQCIHFHQVPWLSHRMVFWLSYSIGTRLQSPTAFNPIPRRLFQHSSSFKIGERILPTIDVDTLKPWRRSRTNSLSLPHLGYCSLILPFGKDCVARTSSRLQLGLLLFWGLGS